MLRSNAKATEAGEVGSSPALAATATFVPGAPVSPAQLLRLQRGAGNSAVARLLQRKLSWHQERVQEIHDALQIDNWDGDPAAGSAGPPAPKGAYHVFNGLSNEDQIRVYRALSPADREKLEQNLDKTRLGRDRMYQAIQQAKLVAADASTAKWWTDRSNEVAWAISQGKFAEYPEGAFWLLNGHNEAARTRIITTLLDATQLDALLRHESDAIAAGVPFAAEISSAARKTRLKRTAPARAPAGSQGNLVVDGKRVGKVTGMKRGGRATFRSRPAPAPRQVARLEALPTDPGRVYELDAFMKEVFKGTKLEIEEAATEAAAEAAPEAAAEAAAVVEREVIAEGTELVVVAAEEATAEALAAKGGAVVVGAGMTAVVVAGGVLVGFTGAVGVPFVILHAKEVFKALGETGGTLLPGGLPEPSPLPSPAPAPEPQPVPGGPQPPLPDGEEVRLVLPPMKSDPEQVARYAGYVKRRRLQHDPRYNRSHTAQSTRWDSGVQPGGSSRNFQSGMSRETYLRGLEVLGLSESDPRRLRTLLFRPNWDRFDRRYPRRFQVDHIVELQVAIRSSSASADLVEFDNFWNYELLDQASNGSAGPSLAANIREERLRLAGVTRNPAWLTCLLTFTVVWTQSGARGQRWSSDEIEIGRHIDAREHGDRGRVADPGED